MLTLCIVNPEVVEEHESNIKRSVQQICHMFLKIKNPLWSTLKTYGDPVERFPNLSSISQVNIFGQFD